MAMNILVIISMNSGVEPVLGQDIMTCVREINEKLISAYLGYYWFSPIKLILQSNPLLMDVLGISKITFIWYASEQKSPHLMAGIKPGLRCDVRPICA